MCAERKNEILNCAARMLKPGGALVYSTCTFAPEEDEDIVIWFLREHKGFKVQDWKTSGMAADIREQGLKDNIPDSGEAGFVTEGTGKISNEEEKAVKGALRLWPHKIKGVGHFAVKFI